VTFLRHLDNNEDKEAMMMICEEFDQGSGFAGVVDLDNSTWNPPVF
jgi:hypothetical protein